MGLIYFSIINNIIQNIPEINTTNHYGFKWHYRGLRRLHFNILRASIIAFILRNRNKSKTTGLKILKKLLPIVLATGILISVIAHMSKIKPDIKEQFLWITSPSGEQTVKMPFYMAIRVIRKRGWILCDMEPKRLISRWQGIKIFFKGDNH